MVYRFKIVSDEVENFKREIEIDSQASFLDLRNALLDSVGYSKDDMNSFFLCDDSWEKNAEITLVDMGSASDEDLWIMADTQLDSLIEDEGQRLIFVFDYITERSFFMELKEIRTGANLKEAVCTVKEGDAPAQSVDLDEFDSQIDKKIAASASVTDLDSDFFGDSEFNEDEIEGFDDFNFN